MTSPRSRCAAYPLAVLLLLPFGGCTKNENEREILPLRAGITIDAPPAGPVVFLRSVDSKPDDDLVPLELVLRPGGSVTFDAFTVELFLEAPPPAPTGTPALGILQVVFASAGGMTPFGACGGTSCRVDPTQPRRCVGGPTAGVVCSNDMDCGTNGTCPVGCANVACNVCSTCPATITIMNPLCDSNLSSTGTTGTVLLGVASVLNDTCPQTQTVTTEKVLAQIGLLAQTAGSVRLRFVANAAPMTPGDCEILAYGAPGVDPIDLGIAFDDGNATFTAQR